MYPQKQKTLQRQPTPPRFFKTPKFIRTVGIIVIVFAAITFFVTRPQTFPLPETRTGYIETIAARSGVRIRLNDVGKIQLLENNRILVDDSENQQVITVDLDTRKITKLFSTRQFGTHPYKDNGRVIPNESFFIESENTLYVRMGGRNTRFLLRVDTTDGSFETLIETPQAEDSLTYGPIIINDLIAVTSSRTGGLRFLNLDGTENHQILGSKRFQNLALGHTPNTILATDKGKLYRIDLETGKETILTEGTTFLNVEPADEGIDYEYIVTPGGVPVEGPNDEVFVALNGVQGGCLFIGKVISPTEIERIAGAGIPCYSEDPGLALESTVMGSNLVLTPAGDLLIAGHDTIQRIVGVTSPFDSPITPQ